MSEGPRLTKEIPRPSARHISSLDGFRGLAFLLVFVRHYSLTSHMTSRLAIFAMSTGQGGWVGVDLFFTLSGFLITGILLDTRQHPQYLRNFFARRALRIFPLYYGVLFVLLLLTPVLHLQWRLGHLAYFLYAGNIAYSIDPTLANLRPDVLFLHLWSLAVEEQFYLLWPWVILFIPKRRHLVWFCLAASAAAFVGRVLLLNSLPLSRASEWCYSMLPTHMDGLLFGALAAIWFRSRPLEAIQSSARRICLLATAALVVVYSIAGCDFYSWTMLLAGFPLLAIFFATVLLQALVPGSWAFRLGSLRLLQFFGKYSYGMYVFHILFAPGLAQYQTALQDLLHSTLAGGLIYSGLVLAGTSIVSVLSYKLYERHWLRLKNRFEYRAASRPVTPPTLSPAVAE